MRLVEFFRSYVGRIVGFERNIRLFILGQFLVGLGMTLWGLFFNLFMDARGFDKGTIGTTLALSNLAIALFAIPAGVMAIRGNPGTLLLRSQFFSWAFYLLAMLYPDPGWLQCFVFLANGFSAFTRVVAGPLILRFSSAGQRTYIFSVNFVVGYLGGILGNGLAGPFKRWIVHAHFSPDEAYRFAIIGGLAFALSGLVPFALMKSCKGTVPAREQGLSILRSLRTLNWSLFARTIIPSSLISVGAGLIVQFMNLYLKDVFSISDDLIGLLMSVQAVTMACGVLLSPVLAERLGRVNTVVATQLLSLPFMIALGITKTLWVAALCFVLRAALMNMASPVANALTLELAKPEEQGLLNAFSTVAWSLSWALAALVYGHVLKGNYAFSFYLASVLYLLSSFLYFLFFRGAVVERQTSRAPS
jgi:MFS family permease